MHAAIIDPTSQLRAARLFDFTPAPTAEQIAHCVAELLDHARANEDLAAESPHSRHHREWAEAARACAAKLMQESAR